MRPEKKTIEKEYRDRISRASIAVLTGFKGLSSQAMNSLRRGLDSLGADYLVVQNRIFRRALEETGFTGLSGMLEGQAAVAIGKDNVRDLAKFLVKFMEEESSLQIHGALWGKESLDLEDIRHLARLPSREILLSQVISGIQAPVTGLAVLLQRLLSGLVVVISEISKKRTA